MANIYQIGAGLVGRTMALDLSKDHTVFLADNNLELLESIKSEDPTIHIKKLDVKESNDLIKFIKNVIKSTSVNQYFAIFIKIIEIYYDVY